MKTLHLIFLLCLCIGCTKYNSKEVNSLQEQFSKVAILSTSFDSLLTVTQTLPINKQVQCIIQISQRDEEIKEAILKQKDLLNHLLPLASSKEQKEILFQLIELHNKLNTRNIHQNTSEAELSYIDELEENYSLTQEEKWKVKRLKAQLLNRRGKQEEYLPIWFELLKEHRIANIPQYIVDDLLIIANHLSRLGDYNQAISTYEEAYQLIIANQLSNLQNSCLPPLIKLIIKITLKPCIIIMMLSSIIKK